MDKDTIQTHINTLAADAKVLEDYIAQRAEHIKRLNIEIEQHNGALSYNRIFADKLQKQLAELAKAETNPPSR